MVNQKQTKPKSLADKISELAGAIVGLFLAVVCVISVIYKFIVEYVIPFLINLFLIALGIILTVLIFRILIGLFLYLKLERGCRKKIAKLRKEEAEQREQWERISRCDTQITSGTEPQQLKLTERQQKKMEENYDRIRKLLHNEVMKLLDHLGDKHIKASNSTRVKKINKADRLKREMEKLIDKYTVVIDPVSERKKRKYPCLYKIDRFFLTRLGITDE